MIEDCEEYLPANAKPTYDSHPEDTWAILLPDRTIGRVIDDKSVTIPLLAGLREEEVVRFKQAVVAKLPQPARKVRVVRAADGTIGIFAITW